MKLHGVSCLFPYIFRRKLYFFLILTLSCVNAVASLFPTLLLGAIIDFLAVGESKMLGWLPPESRSISTAVVFFAISLCLRYIIENSYGYLTSTFSDYIIEDVRNDAFEWALNSFKPYKEEKKEGDILSRLIGDIDSITRVIAGPLNNLLPLTIKLIISLVALFLWNTTLGIISVLLTVPLYCASLWIARQSKTIATAQREAQGDLVNAVSNTLLSIPVIKAWDAEEYETEYFRPLGKNLIALKKTLYKKYIIYWFATQILTGIGLVVTVVISVRSVMLSTMTVGSISIAYSYMANVLAPVTSLSRYGSDLHQADAALNRVFALRSAQEKKNTLSILSAPDIVFSDVCISCNDDHQLHDVNFTARANTITVLSGPSGIGKTTLLHAMLGFQQIEKGDILVGGNSIAGAKLPIGIAFQKPYLMDRSIRSNIAFADDNPDEKRILALVNLLGLSSIIEERGLDCPLGTQGKTLSGGEQRRIAIARAAYPDKPIYLFDEPTAELDEHSRTLVIDFLLRLKGKATILVTSHDEGVIGIADKVIPVNQYVSKK